MTAITDWINELLRFRGSANVAPLFSNVDTVVAALGTLDGLSGVNTYTPTATLTTNVTAVTPFPAFFARIANVVLVFGSTLVDPTAGAVDTEFALSLPIPSNFTNAQQLAGLAHRAASAVVSIPAYIFSDNANDRARIEYLNDADIANRNWVYMFAYPIL